jgi:hypothetical protein
MNATKTKTTASLDQINWDGEALSAIRSGQGWTIVRRTFAGDFAVVAVSGLNRRVVKVLPTLDRARAYNNAMSN